MTAAAVGGPALAAKIESAHPGPGNAVAFGISPDGRPLLASAGDDGTVRRWDPTTGTLIGEPLTGHTGPVWSVALGTGPDDRPLLASAGDDHTVRRWDPTTGTPIGEPLTGHTGPVRS